MNHVCNCFANHIVQITNIFIFLFQKDDLISSELKTKGAVLNFKDNKQLIINYWDLSRFDQKQFKRFVAKFHNLEL